MCQLAFCNLRSEKLNRLALAQLLFHGSQLNHEGTGLYTRDAGLWKTECAAYDIKDIGSVLGAISKEPILAHVRAATKGIVVSAENSHPFEGTRFVLAHNGTLYEKSETPVYTAADDTSRSSDSLMFLTALEKYAGEHPETLLEDMLDVVMKGFKGKFAFLIYDKLVGYFYLARGYLADLYVSYVVSGDKPEDVANADEKKILGYVVMTNAVTLKTALTQFLFTSSALWNTKAWFTEPKLVPKETIWRLDTASPVEVGAATENALYPTAPATSPTTSFGRGGVNSVISVATEAKELYIMAKWFLDNYLDIRQADDLVYAALGCSIADLTADDISHFVANIIQRISPSKHVKKEFEKTGYKLFPYKEVAKAFPDFPFPWTVSTKQEIDVVVKYLLKRKEAAK
jgi:predicted glutamine amidotransferase